MLTPCEDRLAKYIWRGNPCPADQEDSIREDWADAAALVRDYLRDAKVPDGLVDRAIIQTGAELYFRRGTKSGILSDPTGATETARLALDPMQGARKLLDPYLVVGL